MHHQQIDLGRTSGSVYCAEALELLHTLGPESADIIFLDPPFNLGKRYSDSLDLDNRPEEQYQSWLKDVIDLSVQALTPGGALFLYHLPVWALRLGAYIDESMTFRHWIGISMKNGFARGQKLYPAHYGLLYFTKGSPRHFTRPKIDPPRCRTCGEFVKDYGGYRSIIEEKGINLSDIWDDLSPVRHGSKKYRQANELPVELYERIITISGEPGMTYLDPFAGSGTGAIVASALGLDFIAGDILPENTKIILERLTSKHATQECANA